ncbi:unnamed protein product, partial [Rotaria sp. Silwood1]
MKGIVKWFRMRDASEFLLCLRQKKLLWVLKEHGQSCDGAYFRGNRLQEHVIPFLRDPINVLDTNKVILLHDKAP